ncbi:MAG: hypothetical protein ABIS92_09980 [Polyangia bacterium]
MQALPEQANPPQEVTAAVGQVPMPLQVTAAVSMPAVQRAAPHGVVFGAKTQLVLVPLQRLPQVPAAHAARPFRGAWSAASAVHFPSAPARSHAWHEPVHAVSQQRPSTQLPDTHWLAAVHLLAFGTLPHEPITHGCPWQSLSAVQVVAQPVPSPLHLKGAHARAAAGLQVPRPSQVDPVTAICVLALQVPPPQVSPLAKT